MYCKVKKIPPLVFGDGSDWEASEIYFDYPTFIVGDTESNHSSRTWGTGGNRVSFLSRWIGRGQNWRGSGGQDPRGYICQIGTVRRGRSF